MFEKVGCYVLDYMTTITPYFKHCPVCGARQYYPLKANLKQSILRNTKCPKCAYAQRKPTGKSTGITKSGEPDKRIGNNKNKGKGGRPVGANSPNNYWNETELADCVNQYNTLTQSGDLVARDKLFYDQMMVPMKKLVEFLCNRFLWNYAREGQSYIQLLDSTLSHLVSNCIPNCKPTPVNKAYSYFSICAKNYLIQQNDNAYKNNIRNESLDKHYNAGDEDTFMDVLTVEEPKDENYLNNYLKQCADYWSKEENISKVCYKQKHRNILAAICKLYKEPDLIEGETFGKKLCYHSIRSLSGENEQSAVAIRTVLQKMNKYQKGLWQNYLENESIYDM